jgi:hypothetical protein
LGAPLGASPSYAWRGRANPLHCGIVLPLRLGAAAAVTVKGGEHMSILIGILITFLVVILILYLVNLLPLDGRAKQIIRIIVIVLGVISLLRYLAVF